MTSIKKQILLSYQAKPNLIILRKKQVLYFRNIMYAKIEI